MKEFFKVKTIDQALEYREQFAPLPTENIPLTASAGRILAEDIRSGIDLPDFPRSIMDGFAIEENYKNLNSNYRGTSISKFNGPQKRWEQYYVDNQGTTLFLKGSFKNGKMIMKREIDDQGTTVLDKLIWEPMQDGTVRQTWKQRSGEGSWNILFDGLYRKKNP